MRCSKCGEYIPELESLYNEVWEARTRASDNASKLPNDTMQKAIEDKDVDTIIAGCSRWYRLYGLVDALGIMGKDSLVWKGKYPRELVEDRPDLW